MALCETAAGWLFDNVVMLPLTATHNSEHKVIRLAGVLVYVIWFLPAGFVCLPLIAVLLLITAFEEI